MSHKTQPSGEPAAHLESRQASASRAAMAAARVAARYASAPSYSEMLADEARAAMRAAEAASKAAQKAHAAAQYLLAGLEAASSSDAEWGSQAAQGAISEREQAAAMASALQDSGGPILVHEDSPRVDCGAVEQTTALAEAALSQTKSRKQRSAIVEAPVENQQAQAMPTLKDVSADGQANDVAQPIYANLIQFPREVIATRKVRPRRAEGPLAAEASETQLSIFEVDPETISTQAASVAREEPAAPAWMREEWSSIKLDEPKETVFEEPAPEAQQRRAAEQASLSRRVLAVVVDASLVILTFLAVAAMIATHVTGGSSPRTAEMGATIALLVIGSAYLTLFLTFLKTTPGMWYAGIGLITFDGEGPNRQQRYRRLMALPLSVLPLGLGLAWALFDDGHLTWHDRLSRTYLRKR
jgi:uncharacterized RDD family membrane protein YckC